MAKSSERLLPELIQDFFAQRLQLQQHVSVNTVASYRDTLRLLLGFIERQTGCAPCQQRLAHWDAPHILAFLNYLEQQRGCEVRSRNTRLAAIRSFMRFAAQQEPLALALAHRVLTIPLKRADHPLLGFLSRDEITAILAATNHATPSGRRDHLFFNLLYYTGARVSEMLAVQRQDIQWSPLALIQLHGKGRKQRAVPLPKTVLRELKGYLAALSSEPTTRVFANRFGQELTRSGVEKRLRQLTQQAARRYPSLKGRAISPHTFRHTCAMHLLQAKVDIALIALFLGHESPDTTHQYVELDMQMKEECLGKLPTLNTKAGRFKPSDRLLDYLKNL